MPPVIALDSFIARWAGSDASERANYALFLSELADQLDVPRPEPSVADDERNAYVIDRLVKFPKGDGTSNSGWIDLYKRDCFVLEAKQGSEKQSGANGLAAPKKRKKGTAVRGTKGWDDAMYAAFNQAVGYVRALPASEGNPPFVVVIDVGHSFELYSDFTRAGKTYLAFPDAHNNRIMLKDLVKPEVRETLRLLWTDPMALDPSRRAAKVTRAVAAKLAVLAKSLEESGHAPEMVAAFLMRCLFTMFAEDVKLIPERAFTEMLAELSRNREADVFPGMAESLWTTMNSGGFSPILKKQVLRFNGGLFEHPEALPLTPQQLELLIEAGQMDWRDVEPAIFGTLLERALDPIERHKLGAHYTPRAYVERLVMPTIVEPLREEWSAVQGAAVTLQREGKTKEAIAELRGFHHALCNTRVLDPACGSGNFLYVTLEHMKRLEGEVLELMEQFGEEVHTLEFTELTVDPHQLLGIEINPRAAAIADMVLWIGYLQWHFRTHGDTLPREPVLHAYHNIECRDAVLAYDSVEPLLDEAGKPVTRWDGRTMKRHPVTGEDVPDETARMPVYRYINPRKAEWPEAEYVVGNPPFLGKHRMREALGDGYTEALRRACENVPDSADLVMFWWDQAAHLLAQGSIRRFGFITTNSITQTFNRRVLENYLTSTPLSVVFAIPDHSWVDGADAAAVRVAMTVVSINEETGRLNTVIDEESGADGMQTILLRERHGHINADLTIGAPVRTAIPLQSNSLLSFNGVMLAGSGFIITSEEGQQLGLGKVAGLEQHIRHYLNGKDLVSIPREVMVIDLFGLSVEEVRARFPQVYQHVLETIKPERDASRDKTFREKWWLFGRSRPEMRRALEGLPRYIATVETMKHRVFQFIDAGILPDHKITSLAFDDAYFFGILSSSIHVKWALAAGAQLGPTPVYAKKDCFETFPFPNPTEDQKSRIRNYAESIDAHRKERQAEHPKLTITDMYNVLEKLRSGDPLNAKEKLTYETGRVGILKELHDTLDLAVFDAYGWPATLTDEEILERLVALNAERAAEERAGTIRWLRPEYQNPKGSATQQAMLTETDTEKPAPATPAAPAEKAPWPKPLKEQLQAVRAALAAHAAATTPDQVAKAFKGAQVKRVAEILESLSALGQIREVEEGRYVV